MIDWFEAFRFLCKCGKSDDHERVGFCKYANVQVGVVFAKGRCLPSVGASAAPPFVFGSFKIGVRRAGYTFQL